MSLRKLPAIEAFQQPDGYRWDVPSDALARWADMRVAAVDDEPDTITIYDMIGEDPWSGGGFTARRMNGALRSIGSNDVTVAQAGVPRVERRQMLKQATGTMHDAAPAVTHDADLDPAALERLIATLRS